MLVKELKQPRLKETVNLTNIFLLFKQIFVC